ncbi:MAG TPA: hypothetical protein VJH68_04940 [Candidatus Nanoarchaeia archaeon]|nr:hypothetical protein [Candidatus Nanoarchaeia archaeon]
MSKKTKIFANYIYDGLGFPVELHDVEMVEFDGKLHPKIDIRKVANDTIKGLVLQKYRLTGNQIKFIRTHFSMSLRDFAKLANESHMAVKKWENFGNRETTMDKNIEIMIRLHIYDHVVMKKENGKSEKINFYNQFRALQNIFLQ